MSVINFHHDSSFWFIQVKAFIFYMHNIIPCVKISLNDINFVHLLNLTSVLWPMKVLGRAGCFSFHFLHLFGIFLLIYFFPQYICWSGYVSLPVWNWQSLLSRGVRIKILSWIKLWGTCTMATKPGHLAFVCTSWLCCMLVENFCFSQAVSFEVLHPKDKANSLYLKTLKYVVTMT